MRRAKGFSLLEVLVSAAIVAILSGIMLSAYRGSVSSAKSSVCVSNLRQIHLAMNLYREDSGSYPLDSLTAPGLVPYFKGSIPRCPEGTRMQNGMRLDYFLQGDMTFAKMRKDSVSLECQLKRGPDFPIAYDSNHASTLNAYKAGSRFYIFIREDGAVGRRPGKFLDDFIAHQATMPCPLTSPTLNF